MTKVIYLILLIAAALFYPLYENILSLAVLVSLLVLPVLSLADMLVKSRQVGVVSPADETGHKGTHTVPVRVTNGSISPLSKVDVEISVRYIPFDERRRVTEHIAVPARSSDTVYVELRADSYGAADVTVERVTVHDLLGLFRHRKKIGRTSRFTFIPQAEEKYREAAEKLTVMMTGDEDGADIPTTAPGDVIDFRDYVPGDRLTLVHHKLSARFDKDIVKIMGASADPSVCIAGDLSADRDRVLEECYNMLFFLSETGIQTYLMLTEGVVPVNDGLDGVFGRAVTERMLPTDMYAAMPVIVIGGDDSDR
ncbi:MAG: DUF58 domain-containing protein [Oscillospiraceae bacterium]|nr:DUF58 domain-containing protein [Oscillospiraceae bacterium]